MVTCLVLDLYEIFSSAFYRSNTILTLYLNFNFTKQTHILNFQQILLILYLTFDRNTILFSHKWNQADLPNHVSNFRFANQIKFSLLRIFLREVAQKEIETIIQI